MNEFATYHTVLNKDKSGPQVSVVGAHIDDESMLKLEAHFNKNGVRVRRITFTNSDARGLPNYTPQGLAIVRWQEAHLTAGITGVTDIHKIDIPDGHLSEHIDTAVEFGSDLMEDQLAIFAPNEGDEHPDHRAAHTIARRLGGNSIPVYQMDTITGFDLNGNYLTPDFYVPISRKSARQEKRSYLANRSQTQNIPFEQRRAMFGVLGMTERRGNEIGIPHAAVVFSTNNTRSNPLSEMVKVFEVNK